MSQMYQAVIVGGGLIGSAMAASLGSKPHLFRRVLLLDAGPLTQKATSPQPPFQNRVLAVNPTSKELLKSLGVWSDENTFSVNRMVVWDSQSNSKIKFDGEICSIAENGRIVDSLHERIQEMPSISFQKECRITKCVLPDTEGDPVYLQLGDGSSISTQLVIGADGINSVVRKAVSPQTLGTDYGQFGLVATLKFRDCAPGSMGTAYQKFLPTGPIALLPLDKEHCSLVWTLPSTKAKEMASASDEDFIYQLNSALARESQSSLINNVNTCVDSLFRVQPPLNESELEALRFSGVYSRAMFPLGIGHTVNYVSKGAALIGDAAHRIHPLAGLGANIGFSDVSTLSGKLDENLKSGEVLGSGVYLKEYESIAQRSNLGPLLATHFLQRMFCNESVVLGALRGLGLNTVNAIGPLKSLIQKSAASA